MGLYRSFHDHVGTSDCNVMRRIGETECVCPGDEIRYEWSISGAGSTVWNGTLFHCPAQRNEIFLLHSRFEGAIKYCNSTNRSIAAHALKPENFCFTSQLIFNANAAVNRFTVTCAHDNEVDLMLSIVDSHTVTVTTGKLVMMCMFFSTIFCFLAFIPNSGN